MKSLGEDKINNKYTFKFELLKKGYIVGTYRYTYK